MRLSLREAAEKCDIPYRSLQNYASGKQYPGAEALIKLHTSLKIDLNWLLTGKESSVSGSRVVPGEISPIIRDRIWIKAKQAFPQIFPVESLPAQKTGLNLFTKIYNQVCHIQDETDVIISIDKAVKFYRENENLISDIDPDKIEE